jgi:type IV fimbrial biogenesis protein FimT
MQRNFSGDRQRIRGASLMELLVAFVLCSLLLVLGVPAYNEWIATAELMNEAQHLAGSLHRARSEAINSGLRVNLCPSAGGRTCAPTGTWDRGWILFIDANGDGQVNAGERVLRTEEAAPPGISTAANAPLRHYVSYTPLGHARLQDGALQMGTFTLCRRGRSAVEVVLAHSGRARIARSGAVCP